MNELKQTMTVTVISVMASSMIYPSKKEPNTPSTKPTRGPVCEQQGRQKRVDRERERGTCARARKRAGG